jgi:VIT1/CCC1 family predicted Fe2+/Mn2+ transporter
MSKKSGKHAEHHKTGRLGWLRAAVLGADDGLLSTASLIIGVASAHANRQSILVAGAAGLFAGAMSMAAGEYVSVSSQRDAEQADLSREAKELAHDPVAEQAELKGIYVKRGLEPDLADEVARQLMARDALAAHARDELGLSEETQARPLQAAAASAISFSIGAAAPLALAVCVAPSSVTLAIAVATVALLATLGGIGAQLGGAKPLAAALRVAVWGGLAMAVTAGLGRVLGTAV